MTTTPVRGRKRDKIETIPSRSPTPPHFVRLWCPCCLVECLIEKALVQERMVKHGTPFPAKWDRTYINERLRLVRGCGRASCTGVRDRPFQRSARLKAALEKPLPKTLHDLWFERVFLDTSLMCDAIALTCAGCRRVTDDVVFDDEFQNPVDSDERSRRCASCKRYYCVECEEKFVRLAANVCTLCKSEP